MNDDDAFTELEKNYKKNVNELRNQNSSRNNEFQNTDILSIV